MNKAYKFRIYPDKDQKELIGKTFGCVRFVYNKMLEEKIAYYKETEKMLKVTPAKYKLEYPWLREVDSLALANAQLNLETAYNNFFRNKSIGFPKFKSKSRDKKSYTTNFVNNNIRIEGKYIILPKLGEVKIKLHRQAPENYKLKSCTISQTPTGKYFVSILYEYEEEINPVEIKKAVGLDFSMKELYVSSDKEFANYPRFYRENLKKLAKAQRKLSKMVKRSKNYYKQKYKIAKIHERLCNMRMSFLHNKSKQIANDYDLVAIEDLNMKGMQQALNFGKSVSDNSWGNFVNLIEYKLIDLGKKLIKVGKWFPSSKTCHICGAIKKDMPLDTRVFECGCGNIMNRDINAAINIRDEGLRMLEILVLT